MPLYTMKKSDGRSEVALYYIHIPKCGGTTVERFFETLNFNTFFAPKDYKEARNYLKIPPTHYPISLIEKLINLETTYCFTVVRNPYSRIISDYKWCQTKTRLEYREMFKAMSFDQFCQHCFKKYNENNYYLDNHITPQHKFVSDNVNRVFKLEDGLEVAINQVLTDIGAKLRKELILNKLNSSPDNHVVISPKTRGLIQDFYQKDFEIFDYRK